MGKYRVVWSLLQNKPRQGDQIPDVKLHEKVYFVVMTSWLYIIAFQ